MEDVALPRRRDRFLEDDDYCRAPNGAVMVIADDVFVHHRLSASFDALGAEVRGQLFERNKGVPRRSGGPDPHRYRDVPGFGG